VFGAKFNVKANVDDNFVETTLLEGVIEVLGIKGANNSPQNNPVLEPGQKLTLYVDKDRSINLQKFVYFCCLFVLKINLQNFLIHR
jgi:hypothetical protein